MFIENHLYTYTCAFIILVCMRIHIYPETKNGPKTFNIKLEKFKRKQGTICSGDQNQKEQPGYLMVNNTRDIASCIHGTCAKTVVVSFHSWNKYIVQFAVPLGETLKKTIILELQWEVTHLRFCLFRVIVFLQSCQVPPKDLHLSKVFWLNFLDKLQLAWLTEEKWNQLAKACLFQWCASINMDSRLMRCQNWLHEATQFV